MNNIIKHSFAVILLSAVIIIQSYGDDKYLSCMDALNKKDYATAIPCLRESVRKDKKNAKAYFYLGKALLEADSAEASVLALTSARDLDTTNIETYVLLGDAYVKQNIYQMAVEEYKAATALDSMDVSIHEKLGDSYMKTTPRQYTEAAIQFRIVLSRDTNNLPLYARLGNLLYSAKQYSNSLQFLYHKVTRDSVNSQKERLELVTAMYSVKRYDEMIPFALTVIKNNEVNDSTKTSLIRMLAYSYAKMRDNTNTESFYLQLQQKDSLDAEEYLELAKAQKALNQPDSAIASFEQANRKDSTMTAIFYDLGSLYMSKKMYNEAAWAFERKVSTDTTTGYQYYSHLYAGLCLMQVKEFEPALVHLKACTTIKPELVIGWSSLAACYGQVDSSKAQNEAYQKVIDLIVAGGDSVIDKNKDKLSEAYRIQGYTAFVEKKYDRSLELLKKALIYDPKDCQANLLTAQCYAVLKNNDEAKKYLCRTFSLCPKNKDAEKLGAFLGVAPGDCGK